MGTCLSILLDDDPQQYGTSGGNFDNMQSIANNDNAQVWDSVGGAASDPIQ
jgi:hypothetical protein